jgi:hypothetical protein
MLPLDHFERGTRFGKDAGHVDQGLVYLTAEAGYFLGAFT